MAGRFAPGVWVGAVLLALPLTAMVTAADAALPPYEPNDSTAQAWGPLLAGQSYRADLQPGDHDYYSFYVTAEGAAPMQVSLVNLGGGSDESTIDLSVVDGLGSPISSQAFIRHAETRTLTVALDPGKYYLEVTSNQGYGDSYVLSPVSTGGSFGPYAPIAGRCAAARTTLAKEREALSRAKGRYQRAVARRRRSRYAGAQARQMARRGQARARSNLASARRRLAAAKKGLMPWCSIPQ